jgi:hypothetical protein
MAHITVILLFSAGLLPSRGLFVCIVMHVLREALLYMFDIRFNLVLPPLFDDRAVYLVCDL